MPLHGVGLIVGGTIAVIGSGYAFKKFVYDPHLAAYVEAFIAQHPLLHSLAPNSPGVQATGNTRHPLAVPAASSSSSPTYGTSSARQAGLTSVRRRRSGHQSGDGGSMGVELEVREPLLRSGEREEYYLDAEGLEDWGKSRRAAMGMAQVDKPLPPLHRAGPHGTAVNLIGSDISHSLIDTRQEDPFSDPQKSQVASYQNSDIGSIIFDQDDMVSPPSTSMSMAIAAPPSDPIPLISTAAARIAVSPPRATFPAEANDDTPKASSARTVPSHPLGHDHPLADDLDAESDLEDDDIDLISHPDTARSDYVDAESYTPDGGIASPIPAFPTSPVRRHRSPATSGVLPAKQEVVPADLGLSYIRLQSPPVAGLTDEERGLGSSRGGSMSVVSLSESEGSGDWEAI